MYYLSTNKILIKKQCKKCLSSKRCHFVKKYFYVNRNSLSLCPFVASLKKISLKSDFLPFLCVCFHMYIAPGRGRQPIGEKNVMTTESPYHFAHCCRFKKMLCSPILYTFFSCFTICAKPWAGADNPLGTKF